METVYFDGLRFSRCNEKCYFRNSVIKTRLHRYVWEHYNGSIPAGYEVHHRDGNRGNNDISNLELMDKRTHREWHGAHLTEERREWLRHNMQTKALPAAIEWHQSAAGSAWHIEHMKKLHEAGVFHREVTCTTCGKVFITKHYYQNNFCSNACKSAYRRHQHLDAIDVVCEICGKTFQSSKFSPAKTCSPTCRNKLSWRARKEKLNESKVN